MLHLRQQDLSVSARPHRLSGEERGRTSMTILDDYFRSERSASRNNDVHIHITVNVASRSRRQLYAFKLDNLEKVIRELRVHKRHASVDSIYYDSLLLGIVESREELADLLRLAERKGRIQQSPDSTWRTARPWLGGEKREPDDGSMNCHLHSGR
jgi:hypothetical protein